MPGSHTEVEQTDEQCKVVVDKVAIPDHDWMKSNAQHTHCGPGISETYLSVYFTHSH